MKKTTILLVGLVLSAVTFSNAQEVEYNGGEKVEYVGLYSYRIANGQIIFKTATADWNSMQEFKKAKNLQGFRLEDTSKSTIHKQNKLKEDRIFNVDNRK